MSNVEVVITVTVNHAYPHRDYEAQVTREVKLEADIVALLGVSLDSLCADLALNALMDFRKDQLRKEREEDNG